LGVKRALAEQRKKEMEERHPYLTIKVNFLKRIKKRGVSTIV